MLGTDAHLLVRGFLYDCSPMYYSPLLITLTSHPMRCTVALLCLLTCLTKTSFANLNLPLSISLKTSPEMANRRMIIGFHRKLQ